MPELDRLVDRAPVLADIEPLGIDLASLGVIGHEALSFIASGVKPPASWRDTTLGTIDRAAVPRGAAELMVVPALRKLAIAAAEIE